MARRSTKADGTRPKYWKLTKLFVLDTNVLMHDPTSLFRFEEHDIFVPMMTLEELDANKKGMSEVARNARQASRLLDEIVTGAEHASSSGHPLAGPSRELATGRLFLQTEAINGVLPASLPTAKADNQIIGVVMHLGREVPEAAGDPGVQGHQHAHQGPRAGPRRAGLLQRQGARRHRPAVHRHARTAAGLLGSPRQGHRVLEAGRPHLLPHPGPLCPDLLINEFVWQEGEQPLAGLGPREAGKTAVLETLIDYSHQKNAVWGITARNREQNFALNLLMNPEIDFVTLLGQAGTGKTLLTLAAGLTQTLETKRYSEIIITRVTVPVGEDIGFLPGTEEEKMTPWMGALEDNLDVLNKPAEDLGTGRVTAATGAAPRPWT
jgi:PhoH-like ATPase